MKASIQAVRAITGVYFKKLITTSAIAGSVVLALLWALIVWLGTSVDPLWWLFLILLAPLTIAAIIIYRLLLGMGDELIPRPLTKAEIRQITTMSEKIFAVAGAVKHPWYYRMIMLSKDVLRGKESMYIKKIVSDTTDLRDDFLNIRQLFVQ